MEKNSNLNVAIGVIIPAYNAEKTITPCLESILKQTYKATEIIIVDDGSKDKTWDILNNFSQREKSIKIIHQENKGVSVARNSALDRLSSLITHICFVDSDDTVEPNYLKSFAINVEKDKFLVQGFIKCSKGEKDFISYNVEKPLIKQLTEKGDLGHIFDKCFDASIINKFKIRFKEQFTFAEDEAFVLDYMQYVPEMKYIDIAQYNYYVPISERKYSRDNNMGMYFYCLSRMGSLCEILDLPLHTVYTNRLYRCGRQFFKPFNYKNNSIDKIQKYFNGYIECTKKIPSFFSVFHFIVLLLWYLGLAKFYISFFYRTANLSKSAD